MFNYFLVLDWLDRERGLGTLFFLYINDERKEKCETCRSISNKNNKHKSKLPSRFGNNSNLDALRFFGVELW